jgi:hypothetical protein
LGDLGRRSRLGVGGVRSGQQKCVRDQRRRLRLGVGSVRPSQLLPPGVHNSPWGRSRQQHTRPACLIATCCGSGVWSAPPNCQYLCEFGSANASSQSGDRVPRVRSHRAVRRRLQPSRKAAATGTWSPCPGVTERSCLLWRTRTAFAAVRAAGYAQARRPNASAPRQSTPSASARGGGAWHGTRSHVEAARPILRGGGAAYPAARGAANPAVRHFLCCGRTCLCGRACLCGRTSANEGPLMLSSTLNRCRCPRQFSESARDSVS